MAVLHIINTGGPGGAETVCANLIRRLDGRRWRPIAVVPDEGWIYRELTAAGVPTIVLGHGGRSDLPRYFRLLMRLINRHDVRLIHGHLFGPSFTASLLGLIQGIPVIATMHGQSDLSPQESFRRVKFWLLRRGATRVVFVSEPLREFFLATGLLERGRTAVIPNGVDITAFMPTPSAFARAELGVLPDQFLVGAVGNLRPAKGYDIFLRAAALLKAQSETYRFVIVGNGEESDLGQELSALRGSLGLATAVQFLGFRSPVNSVMSAFDVYALTSRAEGFSLSVVEAMALGLPVVATRCGGPEQILDNGRTGLLIENGSPEAVAEAVDRLRNNGAERARLAAAGRVSVRERFTVESQVQQYERLYEECVAERHSTFHVSLREAKAVSEVRRPSSR